MDKLGPDCSQPGFDVSGIAARPARAWRVRTYRRRVDARRLRSRRCRRAGCLRRAVRAHRGIFAGRHDRAGYWRCSLRTACGGWCRSARWLAAARKSASGCWRGLPSCGSKASGRSPARHRSVGSHRSSSRATPIWCSTGCSSYERTMPRPTRPHTRCSRRVTWGIRCTRSASRR